VHPNASKNLRVVQASCLRHIHETGETPVLGIDLQWHASISYPSGSPRERHIHSYRRDACPTNWQKWDASIPYPSGSPPEYGIAKLLYKPEDMNQLEATVKKTAIASAKPSKEL
jgi:hypothetical protein